MSRKNADRDGAEPDPRASVDAPVTAALDRIIVMATLGIVLVGTLTLLPLVAEMDEALHDAVHLALPLGWGAYAAATGVWLALGPRVEGDPWRHAAETDRQLTRFARRVSWMMVLGWASAVVAVFVHHHLGAPLTVLATLVVDGPIMLVTGGLAAVAWLMWCRATLAAAERESRRRLRQYWSAVPPARAARPGPGVDPAE